MNNFDESYQKVIKSVESNGSKLTEEEKRKVRHDLLESWIRSVIPRWVYKIGSINLRSVLIGQFISKALSNESTAMYAYENSEDAQEREFEEALHEARLRRYGIDIEELEDD